MDNHKSTVPRCKLITPNSKKYMSCYTSCLLYTYLHESKTTNSFVHFMNTVKPPLIVSLGINVFEHQIQKNHMLRKFNNET